MSSLASGVDIAGHETRFQSLLVAIHMIGWWGGREACNVCLDDARRGLERLLLVLLSKLVFGIRSALNFSWLNRFS